MSVIFDWDVADFNRLVKSCEFAQETPYILKYMPKKSKLLEAGCGLGRYVAYLSQRGFSITGIELNEKTVNMVNKLAPELSIKQGDITKLSFEDNTFSGIISLGVVEHFPNGPKEPLKELFRVLKPKSYAIITVPSFNYLRRIKRFLGFEFMNQTINLKRSIIVQKIFGKKLNKISNQTKIPYKNCKKVITNTFFEYFFTKHEFEKEIKQVGFEIVESRPVQHMDGIFHELGPHFTTTDMVKFYPKPLGKILNTVFSLIPFFHNHMHLCVVTK